MITVIEPKGSPPFISGVTSTTGKLLLENLEKCICIVNVGRMHISTVHFSACPKHCGLWIALKPVTTLTKKKKDLRFRF